AQQGFFTIERTFPARPESQQVIKEPCTSCRGSGRVQQEKTLSVSIPQGVEDGTRIRLAGEGEAGLRGAPSGDLYIFISIASHRIFLRDGSNIHCRVPVPFTTAALSGHIEVPTVDGSRARITVPAGTQSGHQFRLRGKGMSILRSKERGDMFVEVYVETPVNLSKKQKELLGEFREIGSEAKNSPESEGFFTKVKDLWEDLKS
ncbi:MAG: molecular chaperone DnaJ, partial [Proteobacteria bacterium]|nr:molecular chaperone DnaJ [Pseudomonadota bacterium]